MVKVTWKGWRDHPTEKSPEAYEFLMGQNLKPFYKVFSTPQNEQPEQTPESHEQKSEDEELHCCD